MKNLINHPSEPTLAQLCSELWQLNESRGDRTSWIADELELCRQYGVFRWFHARKWGGAGWTDREIVAGYLALSSACLSTAFVLTQRSGACTRIEDSPNEMLKERLLPDLVSGKAFATIGISHLTTSRQHTGAPALIATETPSGFELNGYSPWVTGVGFAQHVVVGALLTDDRQVLIAAPIELAGIKISPAAELVALTASQTGMIRFTHVQVDREWVVAGPAKNVMRRGTGANTGGLQTSTLAAGLANSAIEYLENQSQSRPELVEASQSFRRDWQGLCNDLFAAAESRPACTNEELRVRANKLVLRATQAALAAAKGAGFVAGNPVGRWCREALFFLVWSCPQPVVSANICEFAGLAD